MVFACRCCSELYEAEVAQGTSLFYWVIEPHDTTHLKMALKTILISSGLPENRTIEQDPLSEVEDFPRKIRIVRAVI